MATLVVAMQRPRKACSRKREAWHPRIVPGHPTPGSIPFPPWHWPEVRLDMGFFHDSLDLGDHVGVLSGDVAFLAGILLQIVQFEPLPGPWLR